MWAFVLSILIVQALFNVASAAVGQGSTSHLSPLCEAVADLSSGTWQPKIAVDSSINTTWTASRATISGASAVLEAETTSLGGEGIQTTAGALVSPSLGEGYYEWRLEAPRQGEQGTFSSGWSLKLQAEAEDKPLSEWDVHVEIFRPQLPSDVAECWGSPGLGGISCFPGQIRFYAKFNGVVHEIVERYDEPNSLSVPQFIVGMDFRKLASTGSLAFFLNGQRVGKYITDIPYQAFAVTTQLTSCQSKACGALGEGPAFANIAVEQAQGQRRRLLQAAQPVTATVHWFRMRTKASCPLTSLCDAACIAFPGEICRSIGGSCDCAPGFQRDATQGNQCTPNNQNTPFYTYRKCGGNQACEGVACVETSIAAGSCYNATDTSLCGVALHSQPPFQNPPFGTVQIMLSPSNTPNTLIATYYSLQGADDRCVQGQEIAVKQVSLQMAGGCISHLDGGICGASAIGTYGNLHLDPITCSSAPLCQSTGGECLQDGTCGCRNGREPDGQEQFCSTLVCSQPCPSVANAQCLQQADDCSCNIPFGYSEDASVGFPSAGCTLTEPQIGSYVFGQESELRQQPDGGGYIQVEGGQPVSAAPVLGNPPVAYPVQNGTFTFSAPYLSTAAPGLSIDPLTGEIKGTPWLDNAESVTVTLSNNVGAVSFSVLLDVQNPKEADTALSAMTPNCVPSTSTEVLKLTAKSFNFTDGVTEYNSSLAVLSNDLRQLKLSLVNASGGSFPFQGVTVQTFDSLPPFPVLPPTYFEWTLDVPTTAGFQVRPFLSRSATGYTSSILALNLARDASGDKTLFGNVAEYDLAGSLLNQRPDFDVNEFAGQRVVVGMGYASTGQTNTLSVWINGKLMAEVNMSDGQADAVQLVPGLDVRMCTQNRCLKEACSFGPCTAYDGPYDVSLVQFRSFASCDPASDFCLASCPANSPTRCRSITSDTCDCVDGLFGPDCTKSISEIETGALEITQCPASDYMCSDAACNTTVVSISDCYLATDRTNQLAGTGQEPLCPAAAGQIMPGPTDDVRVAFLRSVQSPSLDGLRAYDSVYYVGDSQNGTCDALSAVTTTTVLSQAGCQDSTWCSGSRDKVKLVCEPACTGNTQCSLDKLAQECECKPGYWGRVAEGCPNFSCLAPCDALANSYCAAPGQPCSCKAGWRGLGNNDPQGCPDLPITTLRYSDPAPVYNVYEEMKNEPVLDGTSDADPSGVWAIVSGALLDGLSFDTSTGVISGKPRASWTPINSPGISVITVSFTSYQGVVTTTVPLTVQVPEVEGESFVVAVTEMTPAEFGSVKRVSQGVSYTFSHTYPGAQWQFTLTSIQLGSSSGCVSDDKIVITDAQQTPVLLCGGTEDAAAGKYTFSDGNGRSRELGETVFTSMETTVSVSFESVSSMIAPQAGFELAYTLVIPRVDVVPGFLESFIAVNDANRSWALPAEAWSTPTSALPVSLAVDYGTLAGFLTSETVGGTGQGQLDLIVPDMTTVPAGTYPVVFLATNAFGYSGSRTLLLTLVEDSVPDSTSTIDCGTELELDDTSSAPILCTITPKVAGAVVYSRPNRFSPKWEISGIVSDAEATALAGEDASNSLTFAFQRPVLGGEALITASPSADEVTIFTFATPDETTRLFCSPETTKSPNETITCVVEPRKSESFIFARWPLASNNGALAVPQPLSAPAGETEFLLRTFTPFSPSDFGSSFTGNITLGQVPGEYLISATSDSTNNNGNQVARIAFAQTPTSATLSCISSFVSVDVDGNSNNIPLQEVVLDGISGDSADCTLTLFANVSGTVQEVIALASDLSFTVNPPGAITASDLSAEADSVFTFQVTLGPIVGAVSVTVAVDDAMMGIIPLVTQETRIFEGPDETSLLFCDTDVVVTNGEVKCTLFAQRLGQPVLSSALVYSLSSTTSGVSGFSGLTPVPGTNVLLDGTSSLTLFSQYEFTYSVGPVSREVSISNGISQDVFSLTVTSDPDETSVVKCEDYYVLFGESTTCYVEARNNNIDIFTYGDKFDLALSVQGQGSLDDTVPQPLSGGTLAEPDSWFSFVYFAPAAPNGAFFSGPAVIRVRLENGSSITAAVVVAQIPDATSTLECRDLSVLPAGVETLCTLLPRIGGTRVHAPADSFEPMALDANSAVSLPSPDASNRLQFGVTITGAFTDTSVFEPLTDTTLTFIAEPSGQLLSWMPTDTFDKDLITRDDDAGTPGQVEDISGRFADLSCSATMCIAATSTGDVYTWGRRDLRNSLGRDGSSSELEQVKGVDNQISASKITHVFSFYLESSDSTTGILLADDGRAFMWTDSITPELLTARYSSIASTPFYSQLTSTNDKGPFFMVSGVDAGGFLRISTWGPTETQLYLGRATTPELPGLISLVDAQGNSANVLASDGDVTAMVCGDSFGIVILRTRDGEGHPYQDRLFSWGSRLDQTVLSGRGTPTESPVAIKDILESVLDGTGPDLDIMGASASDGFVALWTRSGEVAILAVPESVYTQQGQNGAENPYSGAEQTFQKARGTLEYAVVTTVSVGPTVAVAADLKGIVHQWQPVFDCGGDTVCVPVIPSISSVPVQAYNAPYSVSALHSSEGVLLLGVVPPVVSVDSSTTIVDSFGCSDTTHTCNSLTNATEFYTVDGTQFDLVSGTLNEGGIESTASDLLLRGAPRNSDGSGGTKIDCGGEVCLSFTGARLRIEDITLVNGTSTTDGIGGALTVSLGQVADVKGLQVSGCSGPKGGAIAVQGVLSLKDSTLTGNTATLQGGALHCSGVLSSCDVKGSVFDSNSAPSGGAVHLADGSSGILTQTTFTGNEARTTSGGSMSMRRRLLATSDGKVGGAVAAVNSKVALNQVDITSSTADNGGAVFVSDGELNMSNSTMIGNVARVNGGALLVEFGEVSIFGSTIQRNSASLGAGVYCLGDRTLDIEASSVSLNAASVSGGALFATFCAPDLMNVDVLGNSAVEDGGGALIGVESTISIHSSQVANNTANGNGGALSFQNNRISSLTSTVFANNVASVSGGALHILEGGDLTIAADVQFTANQAGAGGGAIFWSRQDKLEPFSGLDVSAFSGNTATLYGDDRASQAHSLVLATQPPVNFSVATGTIFSNPLVVELVDYYTQAVATDDSTSVSAWSDNPDVDFTGVSQIALRKGSANFTSLFAVQYLVNEVGRFSMRAVVGSETLATPFVSFRVEQCDGGFFFNEDLQLCLGCPQGSYVPLGQQNCTLCPAGKFSDAEGSPECEQCLNGTFSAEGATQCIACEKGFKSVFGEACTPCAAGERNPNLASASCEVCEAGKFSVGAAADCTDCPTGFYSRAGASECTSCGQNAQGVNVDGSNKAATSCECQEGYFNANLNETTLLFEPVCTECQIPGAACPAGTRQLTMQADFGFWPATGSDNKEFIQCINTACQGGADGGCQEGYTGALCTECADGLGRKGSTECEKCPSRAANRAWLSFAVLVAILIVALFTYSTIRANQQIKGLHTILLKIIFSGIQFNSIAASFDFEWPDAVQDVLAFQSNTVSVGTGLLSLDCLLRAADIEKPFYAKCLLALVVPLLVLVLPGIFYLPFYFYYKDKPHDHSQPWHKIVRQYWLTTITVILFLIHPALTQQTMYMFSCRDVGAEGQRDLRLVQDMRETCYGSSHTTWVLLVGLPMLVFYVAGIPLFGARLLWRHRNKLAMEKTKRLYYFLYAGYETRYFYWELVIVARKVGLVCISVFFAYNTHIQALMAVLLVTVAAGFHLWTTPFYDKQLDVVEFASLATTFVTFYCGQYLFVDNLETGAKTLVSVLIIMSNVAFLILGAVVLYRVVRNRQDYEIAALTKAKEMERLGLDPDYNVTTIRADGDHGLGTARRRSKLAERSRSRRPSREESRGGSEMEMAGLGLEDREGAQGEALPRGAINSASRSGSRRASASRSRKYSGSQRRPSANLVRMHDDDREEGEPSVFTAPEEGGDEKDAPIVAPKIEVVHSPDPMKYRFVNRASNSRKHSESDAEV